jgi:hypothetical protein
VAIPAAAAAPLDMPKLVSFAEFSKQMGLTGVGTGVVAIDENANNNNSNSNNGANGAPAAVKTDDAGDKSDGAEDSNDDNSSNADDGKKTAVPTTPKATVSAPSILNTPATEIGDSSNDDDDGDDGDSDDGAKNIVKAAAVADDKNDDTQDEIVDDKDNDTNDNDDNGEQEDNEEEEATSAKAEPSTTTTTTTETPTPTEPAEDKEQTSESEETESSSSSSGEEAPIRVPTKRLSPRLGPGVAALRASALAQVQRAAGSPAGSPRQRPTLASSPQRRAKAMTLATPKLNASSGRINVIGHESAGGVAELRAVLAEVARGGAIEVRAADAEPRVDERPSWACAALLGGSLRSCAAGGGDFGVVTSALRSRALAAVGADAVLMLLRVALHGSYGAMHKVVLVELVPSRIPRIKRARLQPNRIAARNLFGVWFYYVLNLVLWLAEHDKLI